MKPISDTARREFKLVGLYVLLILAVFILTRLVESPSISPKEMFEWTGMTADWRIRLWQITPLVLLVPLGLAIDRFGPTAVLAMVIVMLSGIAALYMFGPHKETIPYLAGAWEIASTAARVVLLPAFLSVLVLGVRKEFFGRWFIVLWLCFENIPGLLSWFSLNYKFTFSTIFPFTLQKPGFGVVAIFGVIAIFALVVLRTNLRSSQGAVSKTLSGSLHGFKIPALWMVALLFALIAFINPLSMGGRYFMLAVADAYGVGENVVTDHLYSMGPVAGVALLAMTYGGYIAGAFLADMTRRHDLVVAGFLLIVCLGGLLLITAILPLAWAMTILFPLMGVTKTVALVSVYTLAMRTVSRQSIGITFATITLAWIIGGHAWNWILAGGFPAAVADANEVWLYLATLAALCAIAVILRTRKYVR